MIITVEGHNFTNELERLCGLFFPDERVRFSTARDGEEETPESADDGPESRPGVPVCASVLRRELEGGGAEIITTLCTHDKRFETRRNITPEQDADRRQRELALADGLYKLLKELTGYEPPWGMLTGVRPVKLARMLLEDMLPERVREEFVGAFHCSEEKYRLCMETEKRERDILSLSRDDSFSLYISIPFCPTRCNYCSFVSQSVEKAFRLIPDYVELLVKELEYTAEIARQLGLRLETVYMGGGTPTTLTAEQLSRILGAVNNCFDMSSVREMTVEAGRPDTITPEKLAAIKSSGAGRISINPQTLSDEVLRIIGRAHTAAQFFEAMDMARAAGFGCINTDLIAGLTGDTVEGFEKTLSGVLALEPENITVHTLAMKRASRLVTGGTARADAQGKAAGKMLSLCSASLPAGGYHPYYLYRQSHITGNLENVGWSKEGFDGLYNAFIMDETHTILAAGAGAVTKLRQPRVNNIERIYNYKFPYEYIERFDNILARKERVRDFYAEFC